MLKRTTLAILGLTASSFAFAGMYAPPPAPTCTPGDVTVPCEAKQWDLGVQALYLKPVYGANRGYAYNPVGSFKEIDNKMGWGYRLEGSYHFNTGNDATVTWMHYDVDSNRGAYAGLTPFSAAFVPFNLFMDNKFDQVNMVMGQHVDMGLVKNARFYGGLQYAEVHVDSRHRFTATPLAIAALTPRFRQFHNSDFDGIGPVAGVDYSYELPQGFSLTANTAGSLLYGSSRYSSGYVFDPSNLVVAPVYGSKKSIVPSVEAKLGINFAHEMGQGVLNIEGGYQAVNYFDVLQTRFAGASFGTITDSDFGLYGPYFGLKWVANA